LDEIGREAIPKSMQLIAGGVFLWCFHGFATRFHVLGDCLATHRSTLLPGASPNWKLKENFTEDRTPFLLLSPPFVPYSSYPLGTIRSGIEMPSLINLLYVFEKICDIFYEKTNIDGPGPPTSGA